MNARRLFALMMVLLMLLLTACGGSSQSAADHAMPEAEAPMENISGSLTTGSGSLSDVAPENRKLIKTVNMDVETEDLEPLLAAVDEKIVQLGGYVESREIYNGSAYSERRYRRADLTIRIPAEQVDLFVEHVSGVSNIISSNEYIEDVTLRYVDTDSRRKALETEQERLMVLLEQAETMADLLEIEARLTEVRYELESVTSQLRTMDNLVSYATIHLYISEVQEYTPVAEKTVWQRIRDGFMDSMEGVTDGIVDFFVWIIVNSPYLILWGTIAAIAAIGFHKGRKKRAAKKQLKEEKKDE